MERLVTPDLHGFHKWSFDSLGLLHDFVFWAVVARRENGILAWKRCLNEELSSRPFKWLRPDLLSPLPFWCVPLTNLLFVWFLCSQPLLMPIPVRPGCPFEEEMVERLSPLLSSHSQEELPQLPVLTGEDLCCEVLAKKATSGGLDGWGWNDLKALLFSCYLCLAWILRKVEGLVLCLKAFLMRKSL